jgi:hypothetical protein
MVAQIGKHFAWQIIKVMASSAFMYAVIYATKDMFAWYIAAAAGAVAYFFALIVMRGINLRIIKLLR